MTFTLGTHNLLDDEGTPSFFCDAILFTEAVARTVRARARQRWAHAKGRLRGYRIVTCRQQPDLVVALRRRLFKVTGASYTKYVDGVPGVTPHRGTFLVFALHRPTGIPCVFVDEHRINAAFPPFVRGEAKFREAAWKRHTAGTLDTVDRLKDSGYLVPAGGDLNTPHGVSGYRAVLREAGTHFDRLGVSAPAHIRDIEYLSRKGSDHPRLRATVTMKEKN